MKEWTPLSVPKDEGKEKVSKNHVDDRRGTGCVSYREEDLKLYTVSRR